MIARDVRVVGRVQGVGFRWHTRSRCLELGLSGWVRNAPDGTVLIRVEGEADAVASMLDWLGAGPTAARVERVEVRVGNPEGLVGFEIRH